MKLIKTLALILLGQIAFAQNKPISSRKADDVINISALSSVRINNGEYHIDIYRTKKQIKIVYSFLDSIAFSKARKDESDIKANKYYKSIVNKQPGMANDSVKKYYSMVSDVINKYKVYSKDSITVKTTQDTSYYNLISSVISTSKEQLENFEVSNKRMFLDGVSFTFKITIGSVTRMVYANTPDKSSHPQLYRLITESLEVYRNKNHNNFLDLRRTFGY